MNERRKFSCSKASKDSIFETSNSADQVFPTASFFERSLGFRGNEKTFGFEGFIERVILVFTEGTGAPFEVYF